METHPLDTISAPASIGFVGASSNPANMGTMQLLNLLYSGYPGKVWPVHPRETEIYGLPAYPRVADLPEAPAMFMLVVPRRAKSSARGSRRRENRGPPWRPVSPNWRSARRSVFWGPTAWA